MEEKEIIENLIEAVSLIKFWHNFNLPDYGKGDEKTWSIYYHRSPEMRHIRDCLNEYGIDFV